MHTLHEDDFLAVVAQSASNRDKSGAVLLSFTGIGHGMGAINVQHPEFFGTGQAFDNTFFIIDKTRSWGNHVDFERVGRLVTPFSAGKDVYGIGNSMGGFVVLVASSYLPMRRVLAFAPQFSIDPAVVPWETRWRRHTGALTEILHSKATPYLNDRTQYYLFSSGIGNDLEHARLFPVRCNIHHFLFPSLGHRLSAELKSRKMLKRVLYDCFAGARALDIRMPYRVLSPQSAITAA